MDRVTRQLSKDYWLKEVQLTWKPDLKYLPYEKFLETPYWKAVRCLVMLRAKGKCEKCKKNKPKEVHHLNYSIKGNEHQFLEMLQALCSNCHRRKHKAPRREPRR